MRILLTVSCFLFSLIAVAQQNDSAMIRKIAEEILVNSKAYDNLHTLTKTVGGRLSGSANFYKAVQWGQKALQDAGADKVYLQQARIPHWVRGGKEEATLDGQWQIHTIEYTGTRKLNRYRSNWYYRSGGARKQFCRAGP